jgi:CelD/BcsL family acetyltransferase involved in cellulose biosynthesis
LLFRVEAGGEIVGLLYCFLYRGWAYHYQSGFCYTLDKRRNPGLLTLFYAINECMRRQEVEGFDFMAGDSEYKRSLSNGSGERPLRWFIVRRNTMGSRLYLFLRTLKRRYGTAVDQNRQAAPPSDGSESGTGASVSIDGAA